MQLGYIGFEVSDVEAWQRLCTEVIGLMDAGENADGSLAIQMDECAQRLFVRSGVADDVCALGLCADSFDEYEATLTRLAAIGTAFETATEAAAQARGVERLVRVSGPYGAPFELATPLLEAKTVFAPCYPGEDWQTGKQRSPLGSARGCTIDSETRGRRW